MSSSIGLPHIDLKMILGIALAPIVFAVHTTL